MSAKCTDTFGRFAPADYHLDDGYVRIFGGFWADGPNDGAGEAITHDIVVSAAGDVTVEVNGRPLAARW